jgi:hypothetical protein
MKTYPRFASFIVLASAWVGCSSNVNAGDAAGNDASESSVADGSDVTYPDGSDVERADVGDASPLDVVDVVPVDATDGSPLDAPVDVPHADVTSDSTDVNHADAPSDAGRVPVNHRPDDSACSSPAPAGNCSISGGVGACHMDSQCTTGSNGRCVMNMGGAIFCRCTYDTCVHDTDCPTGQTCACHGTAYTGGNGNTCTAGNCRVDSDCGAGGYCSPSHATAGCGGIAGYYCHTAADTCTNDTECTGSGGPMVCAFSTMTSHWSCVTELLCP